MATFTMELRELIQMRGDDHIGLSDYPLFDESYRDELNKRIVDHYYFHEIGYETAEMFIHFMGERMRLIMPPMNKLYLTTLMEIDPLTTMRIRTTSKNEREASGELTRDITQNTDNKSQATGKSVADSKSRAVSSTFPQTMLSENQDYATGATDTIGNSTTDTNGSETSNSKSTGAHTQSDSEQSTGNSDTLMEGFTGSMADLIVKYRNSIINVDAMIIEQLSDLFMSLLNTGDAYTPAPYMGYPMFGLNYGRFI